jgi:hypothetical protein
MQLDKNVSVEEKTMKLVGENVEKYFVIIFSWARVS